MEDIKKEIEELKLTDQQKVDLLRNFYIGGWGLWFMVIEDRFGTRTAIELDRDPLGVALFKMYARRANEVFGFTGKPIADALRVCKLWLETEAADYEILEATEERAVGQVKTCIWWGYSIRAGRRGLIRRMCPHSCQLAATEVMKDVSPEISVRISKATPEKKFAFDHLSNEPGCQIVFEVEKSKTSS